MDELTAVDAENAAQLVEFWEAGRIKAGLGRTGTVTGFGNETAVPPVAWAFGDEPEMADRLLDLVLDGTKTATSSAVWSYEDDGEPLPQKGDLSIILDADGAPRALIRTSEVEVVAFEEVTEDFARAEGEGDRTLASWRAGHEEFFRRTLGVGREFSSEMPVLCERFTLLYPR
ncbi:Uncharacterized protein YhfF [Paraoerskovia marina]|uniref:Uncharacterized protein YhfF n=1 Tax=Paraoerskovia marina TaxID=545619 RepID=A0A1H1RDI7_9CELL|nr:ASCH domain-containing protein [Paraoerskovia marina]SDS33814.1 Uncharacterized protein YhfF [Paraoerskovia marina]